MDLISLETEDVFRCFYCPLCDETIKASIYLSGCFARDERAEWLANMVTHYRHEHVRYYNNGVNYVSRFHDYESFKKTVNNRAKRQIIRKCRGFLLENGISTEHFRKLQSTDEKTIILAQKLLDHGIKILV